VQEKLQNAPWWVVSLVTGVTFGAVFTVSNYLEHGGSWMRAIVVPSLGAVPNM